MKDYTIRGTYQFNYSDLLYVKSHQSYTEKVILFGNVHITVKEIKAWNRHVYLSSVVKLVMGPHN